MAQGISEQKLAEWMRKLGPRLINLSAAICRDRHHAEEIVQEAFVKLWKQPPTAGEIAWPAWLRRVVVNLSINVLQRTRRPGALPEHATDRSLRSDDRPDARCAQDERLRRVRAALDRLDESKRSILVLRAYEQLSYEAIAEHLGVPIGTVMSRLNRARAALAEQLRADSSRPEDEPLVFDIRKYKSA
ncbi:MAG: RNA polymerase sigma factor [Planctomycetota bacterium]|jgi:RNA polymerase sigma-70 factor (ECF subfamily)